MNMIGKNPKIWSMTNVYGSLIGDNVSIGFSTEVGCAVIGDNVRIGANCFICEGVRLEDNVFIGPMVCFTNDRFPPSNDKALWEKTIVKKGAAIGAGCVIRCGVTIGEGARIGCGSVVTHDVPAGETWCGNPAKRLEK